MLRPTLLITYLFGAALAALGLVVLFGGGVALPTREPPRQFVFSGVSLWLLGLSPLIAGLVCMGLARGRLSRESPTTRWALGASMAALGLAFLLAPKA
ncbi:MULTISPECIES: hypothetical protein [Methylibium]|uniref:Transmembrane protein n=1 Tax=Methylibium petroleiphilum (strain ATCC BAA-1232 / LMG 22953 / PM1) TaxID=420662 RepID=A2SDK7_METPP|nr:MULTISPECIES: hypothetical protein [Methylibium]ABM93646.1 hypothetical protein Mpe_A0684 [Methylibium petroleiphilum PM1]EWS53663.1 hypothetical protein X551_03540 [Methylibium sp. T29]EWS58057.1 hypothetical protein Y694_04027 [Methylibium sp. T29-B]